MDTKLEKLKYILAVHKRVLVAYSGGADSSFLLYFAVKILGKKNVLAVTAVSETYPKNELKLAKRFTGKYSICHKIINTSEFKNPNFVKNPVNRCFHCKDELFKKLSTVAKKEKMILCDATNYSDRHDYRPGSRAIKKWKVSSPLKAAGITKDEIRIFSKRLKLQTWDLPAQACLASRIPYGTSLDKKFLARIENAEKFLRKYNLKNIRVRHHGDVARIETDPASLLKVADKKNRSEIVQYFKHLGWKYITLDLEGYRTGSLNEVIR